MCHDSLDQCDPALETRHDYFAQNALDLLAISIVVLLFGVVIWLTHFISPPLAAKLNPQARVILGRIGGIILVAIAVQLLAGGLRGLFPVLAG